MNTGTDTLSKSGFAAFACIAFASGSAGQVPSYSVEVVATYTTTTTLRGASDAGHLVGDQVVLGLPLPFVARSDSGLTHLPLPAGYNSGVAMAVNNAGVIVGAVDDAGLPFDLGEPAIWTPDGSGGYSVAIPPQFAVVNSPLGPLGVNGGMCVDINNSGTIVGWSRYQGFQGGPTTVFSTGEPPVNVQELGFDATVRAINNHDVICGGQLVFDLTSGSSVDLGVPSPVQPGNVSFSDAIAFAINDSSEVVVAANLASVPTENYLTYTHAPAHGYARLNEAELPSRFVGFYDNNNLGDVASSGGLYFAAESALVTNVDSLIDPMFTDWDPGIGFIDDSRRIATTAFNAAMDQNALVLLVPISEPCPADVNGDGIADGSDFFAWVVAFGANDPAADINGDGVVEGSDFFAWVAAFGNGC